MHLVINGRFLLQDVTGVQKVAIEFVRALDELLVSGALRDLEVTLLAPARGELVTVPQLRAVRLRRVGRLSGHLWEQFELPRAAGRDPLLCLGNLAPVTRLLSRRGLVHTMVHDLSYQYFPRAYSRPFRMLYGSVVPLVLARSATVFTVSRSEADAIQHHHGRLVGADRLVAVQNGGGEGAAQAQVSGRPESARPGSTDVPALGLRRDRLLYVGSLTRRKNAEGLLKAAVELTRGGEWEVVLIGATSASFEGSGVEVPPELTDRIHFLGQVNDPGLVEAEYRSAKALLFPSFYEASPLPPVEAMRFGCPVVAGDIPSLRERCAQAALYCDPHDVSSIVAQTRRLLDEPDLWHTMQLAGLQQAAKYSWEAQAQAVVTGLRSAEPTVR